MPQPDATSQPDVGSFAKDSRPVYYSLLQCITTAGTMVLMTATWPLWWLTDKSFPSTPVLNALVAVPTWLDGLLATSLAITLLLSLAITIKSLVERRGEADGPAWHLRLGFLLAVGLALLLIMLDQQRFQPWMYQFVLFGTVFVCAGRLGGMRLTQVLVISIYAYSALGKLDYQFLHTVGQDFLEVILRWMRVDAETIPRSTRIVAVAVLPLAELLLAVGLAFGRTRQVAGWLACSFHLVLAVLFSPAGLGHSLGVVFWNVQFALQAIVLFALPQRGRPTRQVTSAGQATLERRVRRTQSLAWLMVLAACSLPVLERFGFWDHWPSWALYAPHSSRSEVFVARTAIDRLPPDLQQIVKDLEVEPTDDGWGEALWIRMPVSTWALQSTSAPVYPHLRSGISVGIYLCDYLETDFEVQVRVQSVAGRLYGQRTEFKLTGREEIERFASSLRVNAIARKRSKGSNGSSQ